MKKSWFGGHYIKLFLYISTASFTTLLADLQRYMCHESNELHLTHTQVLVIVLNFMLQGLIAWRAFIDDSFEKNNVETEKPKDIIKH